MLKTLRNAVKSGDRLLVARELEKAAAKPEVQRYIPARFLIGLAQIMRGEDNGVASQMFRDQTFFGPDGHFVIVGEYKQRRGGREQVELSMLVGRKLDLGVIADPRPFVWNHFHQNPAHVPQVVAVTIYMACGNVGSQAGEAFVTPDGWHQLQDSEIGPALNDMDEQARRFERGGFECLQKMFCSDTFEVFRKFMEDKDRAWRARHAEYCIHDASHSTGVGLEEKLGLDLLVIPANRGREEHRADGVSFLLAPNLYPLPGDIVLSNLAVRFGVDAQRKVGSLVDTDVMCAELTFAQLIRGGGLEATRSGLRIIDTSEEGLLDMVGCMAAEAKLLTQRELALARSGNDPKLSLMNLYATATPELSQSDISLFEVMVRSHGEGILVGLR